MRRLRSERAQGVVEFTLMLPFVVLILFAIVEMAFALYTQIQVRNAASEAARYAAVAALPDGACAPGSIQDRAIDTSGALVECAEVQITYQTPINGVYTRGSGVAVNITHDYDVVTPLPGIINFLTGGVFPSSWDIGGCSDARLESRPSTQVGLTAGADCG